MPPAIDKLLADFRSGSSAALARAVSIVENQRNGIDEILGSLHAKLGHARRIGITGPPGAGKSTITASLAKRYRDGGLSVGIVCVDPTSPFTGGALLGDRVRMESVALDTGVFIRSMATRGSLGGLAASTREVSDVLDGFGFDRVIIETVGVGQSELDVARTADSTVVVLVPESGDSIQTLKAGVMEIADIFVINKSDRPGADRLRNDVELMLGLRKGNSYANMHTSVSGVAHYATDTDEECLDKIRDLVSRLPSRSASDTPTDAYAARFRFSSDKWHSAQPAEATDKSVADRLYDLLPADHRMSDTTAAGTAGTGTTGTYTDTTKGRASGDTTTKK